MELLRGVYSHGFEKPSVIQQKAIVPMCTGRDIIGQAQSGTGKTATFSISVLNRIDPTLQAPQALILAPTRELAGQIRDVAASLGQFLNVKCYACIGGTLVREDAVMLKQGVQVVVGTPGRVLDLISRGILPTEKILTMVLDEADEMLSLGFRDQIHDIFGSLPRQVQTCLFSASMNSETLEITQLFMNDPIKILVEQEAVTLLGIRQFYVSCEREDWKFDVLCDLYDALTIAQTVIFANTKKKVEWLSSQLVAKDFTVSSIHGELDQITRAKTLAEFKAGQSRILIATDLVGRGIDVHGISLVINYDLPKGFDKYLHRIGRSGRFGRKGVAINLITDNDRPQLNALEKFYSTSVSEMPANVADYI